MMATCPRCEVPFTPGTTRVTKSLCAVCLAAMIGSLTQSDAIRTACWCGNVASFIGEAAEHPISSAEVRRVCELAAQMHSGYDVYRDDNQDGLTTAQLVARITSGEMSYTSCGNIAVAVLSMLNGIGATARLFSTTNASLPRGHQQLEWWNGSRWVYIDVYADLVVTTPAGEPMSIYEFVQAVNCGDEWTSIPLSSESWATYEARRQKLQDMCQVPIIYTGTYPSFGRGKYPAGYVDQAWENYWIGEMGAAWDPMDAAEWVETFY